MAVACPSLPFPSPTKAFISLLNRVCVWKWDVPCKTILKDYLLMHKLLDNADVFTPVFLWGRRGVVGKEAQKEKSDSRTLLSSEKAS